MNDTDLQLLARYTCDRAEDAFAELVRRHVNLVYSAALRQVRSPQLAEEVAQSAFSDLAHNAHRLAPDTIVTAWLYQVTRRTAIDVVRREARRQLREQIATEMNAMNSTEATWMYIEPLLDEAVSILDDNDRTAVLLRYFENKSLRAVGQQLGVSDDAAQKRVSRAVERLREFFAKRGVSVGAGGLVVVISANAVQAAPVGLAVTISAVAALAGTAATTSTLIAATTKTIAMTTLQKTLITATVAVLAGAGIYEARQAAQLRNQVQTLQQQQAPLAEQIQQLQKSFTDATNRLAGLLAENSRLKANPERSELLKLRGEVTRLRPLQEDVVALQKMLKQSATGVTEWQPKEMHYAGRATPEDALQTLFWSGITTNISEMRNSFIVDQGDAPDEKALEEYFASAGGHEAEGAARIRVLSQNMKSSDEATLEIQIQYDGSDGQMNSGSGVSGMIYFRKVNGEWKSVLTNVRDKDGNVVGVDIAKKRAEK